MRNIEEIHSLEQKLEEKDKETVILKKDLSMFKDNVFNKENKNDGYENKERETNSNEKSGIYDKKYQDIDKKSDKKDIENESKNNLVGENDFDKKNDMNYNQEHKKNEDNCADEDIYHDKNVFDFEDKNVPKNFDSEKSLKILENKDKAYSPIHKTLEVQAIENKSENENDKDEVKYVIDAINENEQPINKVVDNTLIGTEHNNSFSDVGSVNHPQNVDTQKPNEQTTSKLYLTEQVKTENPVISAYNKEYNLNVGGNQSRQVQILNNISSSNNSVIKTTKKKFTIINEEEDENNDYAKKKTLRKIEEIKSENPRIAKHNSGITRKAKYNLVINQSEAQVINPNDNFFTVDKSFDLSSNFTRTQKKSRSTKPSIQKLPTLDKVLTEKIQNQDFDTLIEDPQIRKLFEKMNINMHD